MEGRVILRCGECDVTREVAGEIPDEYIRSFARAVERDGWAPRPGNDHSLICSDCLRKYAGHESVDDEEKVLGLRNPRGA
jgi:hypothetical protein